MPSESDDDYLNHLRKFNESTVEEDKAIESYFRKQSKGRSREPRRPTNTLPGSAERLAIYAARVARGERIYHPKDRDYSNVVGGTIERVTYSGWSNRKSITTRPRQ